jgi:secondary thiamine-phosphate synthase enzyme
MIEQKEIRLKSYPRGFHLITQEVLKELKLPDKGLLNILIKHTSAALTINENADPSVRTDFNSFFDRYIPENEPYYTHTLEGPDDMPAHLKSSVLGATLTIPITNGQLNLGTWQGIYLCEFRNHPSTRKLVLTVFS